MFTEDFLSLKLVRLRPNEQWNCGSEGVCFLLPTGGRGKYEVRPAAGSLAPGDVLLWDGTQPGHLSCGESRELVFWWFSLRLEQLYPIFASDEICLLQDVMEGLKAGRLHSASSALAKEAHRLLADAPPQFGLNHRSHLLRVAAACLTEEFTRMRRQRVGFIRPEEHLLQVFERLSAQELLTLSVEELAEKFACSGRHLNRLFHRFFGCSVVALKMEIRLLKAASLLRDRNAKVMNVAQECGFNHLGLFNTCFKRRFGTPPGEWRKQLSQPKAPPVAPSKTAPSCPLQANGLCSWAAQLHRNLPPWVANPPSPRTNGQTPLLSLGAPGLGAAGEAVQRPV